MEKFILSQEQKNELHRAHRMAKNKRDADRIKAVYSLAIGHSIQQVASILMIDEDTLRNYKNSYESGGLNRLLKNNCSGSQCRLSEHAIAALTSKLQSKIYLTIPKVVCVIFCIESGTNIKNQN